MCYQFTVENLENRAKHLKIPKDNHMSLFYIKQSHSLHAVRWPSLSTPGPRGTPFQVTSLLSWALQEEVPETVFGGAPVNILPT